MTEIVRTIIVLFRIDVNTYRSSGACADCRLGCPRSSSVSRNVFIDCSNHRAGGIAASLYLKVDKIKFYK